MQSFKSSDLVCNVSFWARTLFSLHKSSDYPLGLVMADSNDVMLGPAALVGQVFPNPTFELP